MLIELKGLPKISLNQWYSSTHWTKRKDIKDKYKILVRSQTKIYFKKAKYKVSYLFYFKSRPLDATNCTAAIKIIEDILFEDDKYNLIEIGGIKSMKGKEDKVIINIEKLT